MLNSEMYLKRNIDEELARWKESEDHPPLLIRGARQIGKSSTIQQLAKLFDNFLEINFDLNEDVIKVFEKNLDPYRIGEELELISGKKIEEKATLIFFDEIQLAPNAIRSLRYFYEKRPGLHIIATGSLLEFALSDLPSFGLGRVRNVFMYPFSFTEFLSAMNEELLINAISNATTINPLSETVHHKILNLYLKYQVIGGMPKAIVKYKSTNSYLDVQTAITDIVQSYKTDFSKYKRRIPEDRLSTVFNDVSLQIGNKFSFKTLSQLYTYNQIHECLYYLQKAGLIVPVVHTAANGFPLGAEINPKHIKYLIFDTGIYLSLVGIKLNEIIQDKEGDFVIKGGLAELSVGLELLKSRGCYLAPEIYFWQREKSGSQAEIDYIISYKNQIVPVEVKSSGSGSMKSMTVFLSEKRADKGLRLSFENFSTLPDIDIFPLYAAFTLHSK